MRLPDADGFIVAAQKLLKETDVVYLHDAEGAVVAAVLPIGFYLEVTAGEHFPPREYTHDHLEPDMKEEVPWFDKG